MTTAEARLKQKIGELVMTIAFLEAQIEARDAQIAALTPPVAEAAP